MTDNIPQPWSNPRLCGDCGSLLLKEGFGGSRYTVLLGLLLAGVPSQAA